MLEDRYDLPLTTRSHAARGAYVEGVDLLLSSNVGAEAALRNAIAADPEFALAHAALGRVLQLQSALPAARAALGRALELAPAVSPREANHVRIFGLLVDGQGAQALAAARDHLAATPRDAMVLAPCTSVFGLIGFSGRRGREAELAALLDSLAPAYGDDWWFLAVHAFSLSENARLAEARPRIVRSLERNPRNGNAAHFYAHLLFEEGARDEGLEFLIDWMGPYPRAAPLHCHLSWHVALWHLERGDSEQAFRVYHEAIAPGSSQGPPINTLTDSASLLWRAELAGEPRDPLRWKPVSDYARQAFPAVGVAYVDVHSALAFAAAGEADALARLRAELDERERAGRLPAGPIVPALAAAFEAGAQGRWEAVIELLAPHFSEHERIGGSRAQRDLVSYTLLRAYTATGRTAEAQQFFARSIARGSAKDSEETDAV